MIIQTSHILNNEHGRIIKQVWKGGKKSNIRSIKKGGGGKYETARDSTRKVDTLFSI